MKATFKITLLLIMIITVSSLCSCNLLNDPQPKSSLPVQDLKDFGSYQSFLLGAYNALQNVGGTVLISSDAMTSFVDLEISFLIWRQIGSQDIATNNNVVKQLWDQLYKGINATNIIIANLPKIKDATKSQKDNLLGQAHFLRALMYYYLVEYFAKPWGAKPDNSQFGVPLKLKPVINTSDFKNLKRASVKEVYAQIIKDLKKAAGLNITNDFPGKATKYAVTALRARIAFIQGRNADAAKFAGQVISSGHFQLNSNVANYFRNEFGSASIFEIANTPTDSPGAGGGGGLSAEYNINTRKGAFITDAYRSALKKLLHRSKKLP